MTIIIDARFARLPRPPSLPHRLPMIFILDSFVRLRFYMHRISSSSKYFHSIFLLDAGIIVALVVVVVYGIGLCKSLGGEKSYSIFPFTNPHSSLLFPPPLPPSPSPVTPISLLTDICLYFELRQNEVDSAGEKRDWAKFIIKIIPTAKFKRFRSNSEIRFRKFGYTLLFYLMCLLFIIILIIIKIINTPKYNSGFRAESFKLRSQVFLGSKLNLNSGRLFNWVFFSCNLQKGLIAKERTKRLLSFLISRNRVLFVPTWGSFNPLLAPMYRVF